MDWIKKNVKEYIEGRMIKSESLDLKLSNPTEVDFLILDKSPGGWSIDRSVSEALIKLVTDFKIRNVVEIGAGYSSIVFHYAIQKISPIYSVISIEENTDWFKIPNELEKYVSRNSMNFRVGKIHFKLGFFGIHASYQISNRVFIERGIDLVFVDGPQYFFGREGGIDAIYDKLKVGCLIVMDDADRYTELCVIYKWLKVYKGLELNYLNKKFGDKGLAILKVSAPLKRRFSIGAFSLGLMQGIKRVSNFNAIKEKQEALKPNTPI